jgi:serine protease Do
MRGFGEIAERLRRSTVEVRLKGSRGGGSGVIWTSSGLILTNAHVARGPEAQIEFWDGRSVPGRLVSRDSRRDLALLRVPTGDLEPASPGDSSTLRPGELVLAIGSPLGFAGALSRGVVHSVGPIDGMGSQTWVRAGVRLAPGNSGGPLANARGEVIGINTAIVNGLGLAVPSNTALEFVEHGPRPSLGVALRSVSLGLLLLEVDPEGAAGNASLKAGDVLLMSLEELHIALDSSTEVLRLRFIRGAEQSAARLPIREVSVRLARRRAEAA